MKASRILLVEDDAAVLSMLQTVLEKHGYAVTTAVSAADGRSKLAASEFDLVLTDMRMETDSAGFEVARAASEAPEPPVVVILTGFPLLAQHWRGRGAHAVLNKPTRVADLLDAIEKLLSVRRATKPPPSEQDSRPSTLPNRRLA